MRIANLIMKYEVVALLIRTTFRTLLIFLQDEIGGARC